MSGVVIHVDATKGKWPRVVLATALALIAGYLWYGWVGALIAVAFGWGLAVLAVVFNVLLVLFDCLINPTGFGSRYMNAGGMKYVTGRRETRLQSLSELTDSE